ncbi:GNAT family N-acetyltransferase [Clostridium botulinum]|uniref:GNAT family N-acetyltransferase n=1 Tax=Clostridium botulinum TaxID=1491 RepID=UPI000773A5AB|nr:GNAT family N-acetyltransferase [Clostridium botulinum]
MEGIVVREYQQQDWPRLMEVHDNARVVELRLAGLSDAFIPLAEAAFNEGLFDYTVCVALVNDKVLGFVAYSDDELAWLYVDPVYKRQGIGKCLINYVVESTAKRPLCVEVLARNEPAMHLYKSMGFEIIDICSGVMPGNELFHITVCCMQKL